MTIWKGVPLLLKASLGQGPTNRPFVADFKSLPSSAQDMSQGPEHRVLA